MNKIRRLWMWFAACVVLFSCTTTGSVSADTPEGEIVSAEQRPAAEGFSLEEAIERSAEEIAAELPKGTRVAVAAFSSEHENLSSYIMDELAGALVDGSLEVADRRNLEYVYKELDFQMSGEVSDETAISIGKFLGARYVVTGQIVKAGGRYRYRLSGINVETAVQESSTRLDVRDDPPLQSLLADLRKSAIVTVAAGYAGPPAAAPKTAGAYLDRGILFASRGEYALAIEDFTAAIDLRPDLIAPWMLRGRALYAGASYVTDVGENFSGLTTISRRGSAAGYKRTAYDRAIADFSMAIKLDPDFKHAWQSRGMVYDAGGDYDQAIADQSRALRLDPDFADAYLNRGNAWNGKGDYDRAIADCAQVIRLSPDNAIAYVSRGNAWQGKGDYDRAIADYSQALRIKADYALAWSNRGNTWNSKGDYDRAIADYSRAVGLDPDFADAWYGRGYAYDGKGDHDRAIADYSQVIRLDPDFTAAWLNRGYAYNAKGEYDRAIADYSRAVRLNPDDAAAWLNRGNVYFNRRDYARARADWTQALRLNPGLREARDNLETLRNRP